MTETLLFRAVLVLLLGSLTYFFDPFPVAPATAGMIGVLLAGCVILLERWLVKTSLPRLIGAALGGVVGLIAALLVSLVLEQSMANSPVANFVQLAVLCLGMYIGLSVGAYKGEVLNLSALGGLIGGEKPGKSSFVLLDTSVIIDGRIADVAETGFMDGTMAIPQFVLRELQLVADSADALRRNRGRRGLDILQRLQKSSHVRVKIMEDEVANVREVDMKLVELGKLYGCKVVTNDFNLNKVAQLNGVEVLNINELTNALKPVVLPGEIMRVFIIKEGKEYNQGVAYLDDGTMVVVDNARRMISRTIDISVTSVLQTTAGKMIFGRFDERTHAVYEKSATSTTSEMPDRRREHSATASQQQS